MPVASDVILTDAPATTDPDLSVTVPEKFPVPCAYVAGPAHSNTKDATAKKTNTILLLIFETPLARDVLAADACHPTSLAATPPSSKKTSSGKIVERYFPIAVLSRHGPLFHRWTAAFLCATILFMSNHFFFFRALISFLCLASISRAPRHTRYS